jgi:hypothetical protein
MSYDALCRGRHSLHCDRSNEFDPTNLPQGEYIPVRSTAASMRPTVPQAYVDKFLHSLVPRLNYEPLADQLARRCGLAGDQQRLCTPSILVTRYTRSLLCLPLR